MSMEENMKGILGKLKKAILLIAIVVLVIAIIVIGAVFFRSKENSYRSIAVNNLEGTTLIKSEQDEKEAYKGMHLNSGDDVKVQNESNLTLLMDADKYLYAEAGTHFEVECVDGEKSGKKVIHLKDGSVLNRLKTNLKDGEVYKVETPNATMAVRGTVFRVTVYRDEDGLVHTGMEVFDGKVQVNLRKENGEYTGVTEIFEAGEATAIIGNTEFAEFVQNEEESDKREIDYKKLPQDVAKVLVEYIDDEEELCIGKELLMDYTLLAEHKMETISGKEATCTEDGYKTVICAVCNEVTENVTIPATGHTLAEWEITQNPTCVKAGEKQRICTVCKTYSEEEIIPALGHTEGVMQVVLETTCTKEGLSQQLCTVCSAVLNSENTQALGHTYGTWSIRNEANCTTAGTNVRTCTRCGQEEIENIAPIGHNYGSWSEKTAATCTVAGMEIRTCSICGETENREIAALGHNMGGNHEHQDLVMENGHYVSCTCVEFCTRDGCDESVSVTASISKSLIGIAYVYRCNNCTEQI